MALQAVLLDIVTPDPAPFVTEESRNLLEPLLAFLLTLFIEWPLFALLSRQGFAKTFYFMLLMNLLSWPLAMILFRYLDLNIWFVEFFVLALETYVLHAAWKYAFGKSLLFAFILNAASFLIGTPLTFFLSRQAG